MPMLSPTPSLTLSPVSTTSDNSNHRPFAGGLLRSSIGNLERRAILGPCVAVIIDARCSNVGMPKPLLHLGNVSLVIERVGGGGRAPRGRANLKTERGRVGAHQLVNAVRRDRLVEPAGDVVAKRSEQRAGIVLAVSGGFKIFMDERIGAGMQRHIAGLPAFA